MPMLSISLQRSLQNDGSNIQILKSLAKKESGGERGTWTPKPLRAPDFESGTLPLGYLSGLISIYAFLEFSATKDGIQGLVVSEHLFKP